MTYYHISSNGDTSMVTEMPDLDAVDLCAEWDLQAPYVKVHKGDYAARNLHFGGWPEITKEQFDAIPADTPAA